MHGPAHAPEPLLAHATFVRRLARSLLRDPHAAEDVVQDTWRAALERPPAGDPRPWLAKVVRNFARRNWRSAVRRGERERAQAREESSPAGDLTLDRDELLQRVVAAVSALPEPYRATILQRFYEGLPPREIARRADVSVETVNTRLKRALARLRGELGRGRSDWRLALGLLAGSSPCLPTTGALLEGLLLMNVKTACVSLAVLGVVGVGLWKLVEPKRSSPAPLASLPTLEGTRSAGFVPAEADAPPERRAPVVTPSATEARVSGRVIDEQGSPVVGALVHVLGEKDPFGPAHPAPQIGWKAWRGRSFASDADGRWCALLPTKEPVLIALGSAVSYEHDAPERWVEPPADGIDFAVRRVPTGTVEVRVLEGASRRPVESFSGAVRGDPDYHPGNEQPTYTGGYYSFGSKDGIARLELAVPAREGRRLLIELHRPEVVAATTPGGDARALEQEVLLRPGETEEVLFVIPERGVVRGFVLDEQGAPIANALVFFGEEPRARGDEPFKPLREERIGDGARSAADGWFELRGNVENEPLVTAIHGDFSSATVRTERAARIVLGARGALRGSLLDGAGRPLAGARLRFDDRKRGRETTTDERGRFAFEHVEAGAHALWTDGSWPLICAHLGPGEVAEIEVRAGASGALALELVSSAPIDLTEAYGVITGLERRFDLREVKAGPEPNTLLASPAVRPGRYWLATQQGIVGAFLVQDGSDRARVELGSAPLVVRSPRRVNVQVVPADADPFLRLMAARVHVRVDAENAGRFRLQPGSYLLVTEAGAVLRSVDVPAEGVTVELP